jgi:calcium-dependent protein kinase
LILAKVTAAGDMFATGLIIYCLLTGTHPFDPSGFASDKQIVRAIQSLQKEGNLEKLAFDKRVAKLSPSCIDLIRRLLHPDPRLRMTSREFLIHPWVQGSTASMRVIPESDIRLKRFWQRRFRGAILNRYAKEMDGDSTLSDSNLRQIFEAIDMDGNGELDPSEVKEALSGILEESNMDDIFQSVDEDRSGAIDFEEFSTIMRSKFDVGAGVPINQTRRFKSFIVQKYAANKDDVSEKDLKHIFQSIDLNGDGVLQVKELLAAIREMRDVNEDDISEWVRSLLFYV